MTRQDNFTLSSGQPFDEEWASCPVDDICTGKYNYKIDWDSDYSLQNWAVQMEFYCEPSYKIGLLGSAYLLGIIVGLLVFIRASDIYGRRTFLFFTSHINTVCYLGLIFMSSSLELTYFLLFLMGLSASVRNNIGYVYGIELMPK